MRRAAFLSLALAFVALGCAKRPDYLSRDDTLDELCSDGRKSYTYDILQPDAGPTTAKVPSDAVSAGCVAPSHAWTAHADKVAGGARARAYHLRVDGGKTVMCCKE